jgi:hypothetical protein
VGSRPSAHTRPVRIVARTNKVGMDRDVRLLCDALSRFRPEPLFSHYRAISPLRRFVGRRNQHERLVFLERITSRWLRHAGHYVLIPNQERFATRLVPLLTRMDHILCKTHHATDIFSRLHPSVHYLGFTSTDRNDPAIAPDYSRFFHLAGGSALKGTELILRLWREHPGWPELTLVQHRGVPPTNVPANVRLIHRYLPDVELRTLQNGCGIHLCPSSSEGWGHSIVEAMSCRAVTVTTDAPPMNEIVGADRGILVGWTRSEPRKLGVNYFVDPQLLESAIENVLSRPIADRQELGAAGRSWFERNDRDFRLRLGPITDRFLDPL